MAPFGKNFLKTRLKSRARDAEPAASGKEIQVSVCEEEKVVCGVTKHTTCADMVQALLDDHRAAASSSAAPEARRTLLDDQRAATTSSSSTAAAAAPPEGKRTLLLLHGDPEDFCLLERWRGFERALPPLTRILRLWNAWGDQKPFIQFLLVKTGDFVLAQPHGGPHAAAGRSKGSGSNGTTRGPAGTTTRPKLRWEQQQQQQQQQFSQSLPVERQKRMVKKAFRKLEKLHKTTTTTSSTSTSSSSSSPSSPPGAGGAGGGTTEDVDRMVQLILTQDHSIRAQIQRMRELDGDIERFEAEAETTQGRGSSSLLQPILEGPGGGEDSEYGGSDGGGVEQLEEEVLRHRELIMELSLDIDAELRRAARRAAEDGQEEECVGGAYADDTPLYATAAAAELERLRAELRRGLSAGVSLGAQTTALDEELAVYEAALASRDQECWRLAGQLRALTLTHGQQQQQQQRDDDGGGIGGGGATVEKKAAPNNNKGPALVQMVRQSGGLLSSQTVKLKHGGLSLGPSPSLGSSPSPSPAAADATDDTDSDTGISSTHSQDSLSPCGDFPFATPPPLDTDV